MNSDYKIKSDKYLHNIYHKYNKYKYWLSTLLI